MAADTSHSSKALTVMLRFLNAKKYGGVLKTLEAAEGLL